LSLQALAGKLADGWVHPADREKAEFAGSWREWSIKRAYYDRAPMRSGVGGMGDAPAWYIEGREALGYDASFVRRVVEAFSTEAPLPSEEERDAHFAEVDAGGGRVTKPPSDEAPVTKPAGGRPPKGEQSMTTAERMRAYRERRRGG
jgi:hypothetical protein